MGGRGKAIGGRSSSGKDGLKPGAAADSLVPGRTSKSEHLLHRELSLDRGEADATAQLKAHFGQFAIPQPAQFTPLQALKSRLGEFQGSPVQAYQGGPPADTAHEIDGPVSEPYRTELAWFEKRFGELRHLLSLQEESKRDIAVINEKLAGVIERLDRLPAQVPGGSALDRIEEKIGGLSRALDETRVQNEATSERIARAAAGILAANTQAQEETRRFESVARNTLEELGQTVVATASRAAVLTAGEMELSFQRSGHGGDVNGLETELRALNSRAAETEARTAVALERVHETLRILMESRLPKDISAVPRRKRPGVHHPISADSSVYNSPGLGFGTGFAQKSQLKTITLRDPTPSDPNLLKALQDAEENLTKRAGDGPTKSRPEQQIDGVAKSANAPEEEKNHPLSGIAIVAIVLLLASAALYYLHARTHAAPFKLSVLTRESPALDVTLRGTLDGDPAPVSSNRGGEEEMARSPSLLAATAPSQLAVSSDDTEAAEDLKNLEAAARHGDREAQFLVGKRFLNASELDGGAATAARWLTRAAEQGHLEALFMLASLYERGAGVSKDEEHAVELYREAATAGHLRAMHNLAVLLSSRGSPANYREAGLWFSRAAFAGLPDSQYNLALLYERGLGVSQDLARAYFWYKIAARSGDKDALAQADRLRRNMPPEDIAAAGAQAGSWRPSLEDNARSASGGLARRG